MMTKMMMMSKIEMGSRINHDRTTYIQGNVQYPHLLLPLQVPQVAISSHTCCQLDVSDPDAMEIVTLTVQWKPSFQPT